MSVRKSKNKNELIVAAAGSGKTTYLVNEALSIKDKNVLITTFTRANEMEIINKIVEINKCIPDNIKVQTWFSFLLEHGVKPYKNYISESKITGMMLVNCKSGLKYYNKSRPVYYKEDESAHFLNNSNKVYSDKISKFMYKCNQLSSGAVINRLSKIYQYVFIDEIQDLAGYDLEVLKLLFSSNIKTLLVGDPRQVTYHTHYGEKYKKYRDGDICKFIRNECKNGICEINDESLNVSYRNNEIICNFSSRIYSDYKKCISGNTENTGHSGVFIIKEKDIEDYLERYEPIQLRYSSSKKVNNDYKILNFGESKGSSFDRVLIYPTKDISKWLINNDFCLEGQTRSRFYVAVTRARHSVAIVYDYDDSTIIEGAEKFTI